MPITDSQILCHSLSFDKGGSETCPSVAFSMEGPMSWTNLTDSDSRLSKFIREITSFLCNCSWKTHKMNFEGTQKRCLYCIFKYLAMTANSWLRVVCNQIHDKNITEMIIKIRNSRIGPAGFDCQQRRESLMQYQVHEPEVFPKADISHIPHSPSRHCNMQIYYSTSTHY